MVVSGHNIKKGMGVKKEQLVARFKDTKEWYFLIFFFNHYTKKISLKSAETMYLIGPNMWYISGH